MTTNRVNGKIYIGKHQTEQLDDAYLGSGKYLRHAFKKYGTENFVKEVLFIFESEDEMNAKEAELVTEEFCERDDTYNICPGGKGGWGYVNKEIQTQESLRNAGKKGAEALTFLQRSKIGKAGIIGRIKKYGHIGHIDRPEMFSFEGRKHSEKSREKMRNSAAGSLNSQFGSMWITDGVLNKKIKKDLDKIPDGWYKGRVTKRDLDGR